MSKNQRSASRIVAAVLSLVAATVVLTTTRGVGSAQAETATFGPVADAYVDLTLPTTNFGDSKRLVADGAPERRSFVMFDVNGLTAPVTAATLRLRVGDAGNSASPDGGTLATTSTDWLENEITAANAPTGVGAVLDTLGRVYRDSWYELDVTSAFTDPANANGAIAFELTSLSRNGAYYDSRESGADAPQLVVTTEAATTTTEATTTSSTTASSTTTTTEPTTTTAPTTSTTQATTTTTAPPTTSSSTTTTTAPTTTTTAPSTTTSTTILPSTSATLVGAGDIASCGSSGDESTAALLADIPGTVFTAGDNAYPDGTATDYANCYNPSWGAVKARTKPAVGNHEYHTSGASAYYQYFGAAAGDPSKGYYSYDLGTWHVVVLNSNCSEIGGCGAGSPQETWLRQDLAAHPAVCTAAYWHHPLFTSGAAHGPDLEVKPLFQALYDNNADVVITGHNHQYERFAPQAPNGTADPVRGIREFVAGMGGASHYDFGTIQPNSEARNSDTYGVLQLTLNATGYSWRFVPQAGGAYTDSGSTTCH
jgi:hypothetical protein